MRSVIFLLGLAVLGQSTEQVRDEPPETDIILPPVYTNASLPERILVFIPPPVPNHYYVLTMLAIQYATTDVRLTVVIPKVLGPLCIITCMHKGACGILHAQVKALIKKSGFKGTNPKEDTFLAGHSVGATCANYMVQGNNFEFAGLMTFGGFVDEMGNGSVANYSIPLLQMAGELDGGPSRPGKLSFFYGQSKSFAAKHGVEAALKLKPVHVLPGMDHSDWCPGFFITKIKDIESEVTRDVAMDTIGAGVSAFLHLNSPITSEATQKKSLETMKKMLLFTEEVCDPYLTAFELESKPLANPPAGVPTGPWCDFAQRKIVGMSPEDEFLLKVGPCTPSSGLHEFAGTHPNYTKLPGGQLEVTCYSNIEKAADPIGAGDQVAAKSIDCKMNDATRVSREIDVPTNKNVTCGDINRIAVEVAKKLIPAKSLNRYEKKGRGFCFKDDYSVYANIGPLWVLSSLKTNETKDCLEVTSSKLVLTVQSLIYPGNHFCKFLSPAKAMDWMMTDGIKPFPWSPPHELQESQRMPQTFSQTVGDACWQVDLEAQLSVAAEVPTGLTQGTCTSQGYAVLDSTKMIESFGAGSASVSKFKKDLQETIAI